ncbi:MAG: hypothetical protein D6746_03800, partial [Bacteroidetes bacterium]
MRTYVVQGLVLMVLGVGWFGSPVRAQVTSPELTRTVAYYRHVLPGQSSVQVNVWGDVTSPGRYEVRLGTGLIELLFLAGGPGERVVNTRELRQSTVRLSRKEGAGWHIVYEVSLDELMSLQQPEPVLQNDDIIKVETRVRQRFGWRDVLTIVGTVGTLA